MEVSSRGLLTVLSLHFLGGTAETHEIAVTIADLRDEVLKSGPPKY